MEVRIVKKVQSVTLILTEDEAEWLHDNMQAPINYDNPGAEAASDREMRAKFFNATRITTNN